MATHAVPGGVPAPGWAELRGRVMASDRTETARRAAFTEAELALLQARACGQGRAGSLPPRRRAGRGWLSAVPDA